jgi:TatD DNase family protein
MLVDVHTHKAIASGTLAIYNFFPENFDLHNSHSLISVGLHPWYLQEWETKLTIIENCAKNKTIAAIGECGLDLVKGRLEEQIPVFRAQVLLSESYRLPLIVHCVKAYNEIQNVRRRMGACQPWILHGYHSSPEMTAQLLNDKGIWFSLGASLFKPNGSYREIVNGIPIDRLFLETDESDYSIKDVYERYLSFCAVDKTLLERQLELNFESVFKP